jgi:hypothetical protein
MKAQILCLIIYIFISVTKSSGMRIWYLAFFSSEISCLKVRVHKLCRGVNYASKFNNHLLVFIGRASHIYNGAAA